jgi:hypothetical protein
MERGAKGERSNTKLFPHHHYNIRFGSLKQLKNMIGILGYAPRKPLTNLEKSYLLGNTLMLTCGGGAFQRNPGLAGKSKIVPPRRASVWTATKGDVVAALNFSIQKRALICLLM